MMRKARITVAQIKNQDDLVNIEKIIKKNKKSDIIVFPEATLTVDNLDVVDDIKTLVSEYKTSVIIGIVLKKRFRVYNYAYYISSKKAERYQKVHVHWTEKFFPGKEFRVVKTSLGKIGMLICFDTAFQESARTLSLMGAKIIFSIYVVPSSFSHKYIHLRERASALNNQIFSVSCARPGKKYSSRSAIFNPHGDPELVLGDKEEIKTVTIDLDMIDKWRSKERIYKYRKSKLYKA